MQTREPKLRHMSQITQLVSGAGAENAILSLQTLSPVFFALYQVTIFLYHAVSQLTTPPKKLIYNINPCEQYSPFLSHYLMHFNRGYF